MSDQKKPVLSIGMIFKNEIRCLERCMKSLQPLREAVPCELIMADTGSDDGSREVAERYADILIDFPWIDDFAAARNAVLARCSGTWYFSVDADEWLDEEISELVHFFNHPREWKDWRGCALMMRNYRERDFNGARSDFMAMRFMRTYSEMHYNGAIHEVWSEDINQLYGFAKTILHHDGYVEFSVEQGEAKRERNMALLRKKLEKNPDDLMTLMQCLESSIGKEQENYIRRSIEGVEKKWEHWEKLGPSIYRYGVNEAKSLQMPELWQWIDRARELFPDSMYTRVDVEYIAFLDHYEQGNWREAIQSGEIYIKAMDDYHAWNYDPSELLFGTLTNIAPANENSTRIGLAAAYLNNKQPQQAWKALQTMKIQDLLLENVRNYVGMLLNLQAQSSLEMSGAMEKVWKSVAEKPDYQLRFLAVCAEALTRDYRNDETRRGRCHAYTALLSLADQCDLGRAAKVLSLEEPKKIETILNQIEDWNQFSVYALIHALELGVHFPLPGKVLALEEMDLLADRIAHAGNEILDLNERAQTVKFEGKVQALCWARALALSVLKVFPWEKVEGENVVRGLTAARVFVQVEREFLPACYAPEALQAERLFLLPPMHRFGWYMVQAFDTLESGDKAGYVRLLREGLSANENMRSMVGFLLEHTPELAPPPPPAELVALADQVRTLLAMYPEDDPAVEALKASEAYRKVARLIEGTSVPVLGGLPQ